MPKSKIGSINNHSKQSKANNKKSVKKAKWTQQHIPIEECAPIPPSVWRVKLPNRPLTWPEKIVLMIALLALFPLESEANEVRSYERADDKPATRAMPTSAGDSAPLHAVRHSVTSNVTLEKNPYSSNNAASLPAVRNINQCHIVSSIPRKLGTHPDQYIIHDKVCVRRLTNPDPSQLEKAVQYMVGACRNNKLSELTNLVTMWPAKLRQYLVDKFMAVADSCLNNFTSSEVATLIPSEQGQFIDEPHSAEIISSDDTVPHWSSQSDNEAPLNYNLSNDHHVVDELSFEMASAIYHGDTAKFIQLYALGVPIIQAPINQASVATALELLVHNNNMSHHKGVLNFCATRNFCNEDPLYFYKHVLNVPDIHFVEKMLAGPPRPSVAILNDLLFHASAQPRDMNINNVKLLLHYGAEATTRLRHDGRSYSPLLNAYSLGYIEVFDYLLESCADKCLPQVTDIFKNNIAKKFAGQSAQQILATLDEHDHTDLARRSVINYMLKHRSLTERLWQEYRKYILALAVTLSVEGLFYYRPRYFEMIMGWLLYYPRQYFEKKRQLRNLALRELNKIAVITSFLFANPWQYNGSFCTLQLTYKTEAELLTLLQSRYSILQAVPSITLDFNNITQQLLTTLKELYGETFVFIKKNQIYLKITTTTKSPFRDIFERKATEFKQHIISSCPEVISETALTKLTIQYIDYLLNLNTLKERFAEIFKNISMSIALVNTFLIDQAVDYDEAKKRLNCAERSHQRFAANIVKHYENVRAHHALMSSQNESLSKDYKTILSSVDKAINTCRGRISADNVTILTTAMGNLVHHFDKCCTAARTMNHDFDLRANNLVQEVTDLSNLNNPKHTKPSGKTEKKSEKTPKVPTLPITFFHIKSDAISEARSVQSTAVTPTPIPAPAPDPIPAPSRTPAPTIISRKNLALFYELGGQAPATSKPPMRSIKLTPEQIKDFIKEFVLGINADLAKITDNPNQKISDTHQHIDLPSLRYDITRFFLALWCCADNLEQEARQELIARHMTAHFSNRASDYDLFSMATYIIGIFTNTLIANETTNDATSQRKNMSQKELKALMSQFKFNETDLYQKLKPLWDKQEHQNPSLSECQTTITNSLSAIQFIMGTINQAQMLDLPRQHRNALKMHIAFIGECFAQIRDHQTRAWDELIANAGQRIVRQCIKYRNHVFHKLNPAKPDIDNSKLLSFGNKLSQSKPITLSRDPDLSMVRHSLRA